MNETRMTALIPAVGAAAGQSQSFLAGGSIPQTVEDIKNYREPISDEDSLQEILNMTNPAYLKTVSMKELLDQPFTPRPAIIEGLLYPGTYLFVGAPKLGKSFLMTQLAYHVSTGTPLWGIPVLQGGVLYLALEDEYSRLQERYYRMFGIDECEKFRTATMAHTLTTGLCDQLAGFLQQYPDTTLIIIDTLQKIREITGESYSYARDYQTISRLKSFADSRGICLMLVHHTRKQHADDAFDMVSGTNGLTGAVDGTFLMTKPKRTSNIATLEITGRDQPDQKLTLVRNEEKLCWDLEKREAELWKAPPEPVLERVAQIVTPEKPEWAGSPTELQALLGMDIQPNMLTQRLNVNVNRLFTDYGIRYWNKRTHAGRRIGLRLEVPA